MMDDVVGLVMVQVISNLGGGEFEAASVARPLGVAVGLAVVVPLVCRFVVKPLTVLVRKARAEGVVGKLCRGMHTAFLVHTLVLLGMVAGASYAGTSNLFAAYLAGAAVGWWDSELGGWETVVSQSARSPVERTESVDGDQTAERSEATSEAEATQSEAASNGHSESTSYSGKYVYEKYYATAVQRILKPFFFVSHHLPPPIQS